MLVFWLKSWPQPVSWLISTALKHSRHLPCCLLAGILGVYLPWPLALNVADWAMEGEGQLWPRRRNFQWPSFPWPEVALLSYQLYPHRLSPPPLCLQLLKYKHENGTSSGLSLARARLRASCYPRSMSQEGTTGYRHSQ